MKRRDAMTTTKQPEKKMVAYTEPANVLGGILTPSASDEAILAAFDRYQALKSKLLKEPDFTHFVRWQIGDGKPSTKGYLTKKEADDHAEDMRKKGFNVTQEKRIKKSGVLKLGKAFSVSLEIVSETTVGGAVGSPTGVTYRVRAVAPNGQYAERTGSCDRSEKGRGDSPYDHISAIALTRASNRASMALLGGEGEVTAEEIVEEVHPVETKVVATTNPVAVEAKRPEQKTEAEIKADLDKKFNDKKAAKPTNERNELYKRLNVAIAKSGHTKEEWHQKMKELYKVESAKDLSNTDLWGLVMGVEEMAKLRSQ
jgi:hypothetical protein